GLFEADTSYTARVTLYAAPGYAFPAGAVSVTHSGAIQPIGAFTVDSNGTVSGDIVFPKTGVYFSGSAAVSMDSAIDLIRQAQADNLSDPLSLKLVSGTETVDFTASNTDIDTGLVLDNSNSPAEVILDGGGKTIELTAGNKGSVITVGSGVTLTLKNITFKGIEPNNIALITVVAGGTLVMEDGALITGNKVSTKSGGVYVNGGTFTMEDGAVLTDNMGAYGGVYVDSNGTFNMNGGNIIENNANLGGGGVYVSGGSFNMNGGKISENTNNNLGSKGGGVYINNGGTFKMKGGEISQNKVGTSGYGGGVYVNNSSTFTMEDGTISDNTAGSRNGGGVCVDDGGSGSTFIMAGGTISGNKATNESDGGGVYFKSKGTFTKTGGTIYGSDAEDTLKNTADSGNGHAVYVYSGKKRNSTAGEGVSLNSGNGTNWE
ncbi:MAG: hypothetical protein LBL06_05885, partial [Treponema sp.]|nr:hypothetical protein [Treponema sp.]